MTDASLPPTAQKRIAKQFDYTPYREADFHTKGPRTFLHYRDAGLSRATGGLMSATHIRATTAGSGTPGGTSGRCGVFVTGRGGRGRRGGCGGRDRDLGRDRDRVVGVLDRSSGGREADGSDQDCEGDQEERTTSGHGSIVRPHPPTGQHAP